MLYRVEIPVQVPQGMHIRPDMGSIMQGALMEVIRNDAAQRLHMMQLRPYTQCIYYDNITEKGIWRLTAMHPYGYEQVIQPILAIQSLYLRQRKTVMTLDKPRLFVQTSYDELAKDVFTASKGPRGVDITFLTPTCFKHDDVYDLLPDVCRYYRGLLTRWNRFAPNISLAQEGLAEELAAHCSVMKLHIDSRSFGLEGITIQGIVGTMRLRFGGNDMMRRLQGVLWSFAPFSGLGIKTAMGMGAVNTHIRY